MRKLRRHTDVDMIEKKIVCKWSPKSTGTVVEFLLGPQRHTWGVLEVGMLGAVGDHQQRQCGAFDSMDRNDNEQLVERLGWRGTSRHPPYRGIPDVL